MKLFYDNIIYNLQASGGISKYWYELSRRLIGSADIRFLEHVPSNYNFFHKELNIPEENIEYDKVKPLLLARYLPVYNRVDSDRLFHSSYYRVPSDKRIKTVVTVHDFTYEHFFKGLRKFIHSMQKAKAVRRADRIICISESTKRDLIHFYTDIDPDKIDVIYNGVNEEFRKLDIPVECLKSKYGLRDDLDYAVYVGARTFYKNFDIAVKACALAGVGLVVVGGGEFNDFEAEMVASYLDDKCVHLAKSVDVETLNEIYNLSVCLLYPSSYEGFGIPPAESIKAGCVPIVMNTSSLSEVVGVRGILCDSVNDECFAEKICESYSFKAKTLLSESEFENMFTWDKCYYSTLGCYKKVLELL